jgi:hypothetical protein
VVAGVGAEGVVDLEEAAHGWFGIGIGVGEFGIWDLDVDVDGVCGQYLGGGKLEGRGLRWVGWVGIYGALGWEVFGTAEGELASMSSPEPSGVEHI